jgi:hypothetical protein
MSQALILTNVIGCVRPAMLHGKNFITFWIDTILITDQQLALLRELAAPLAPSQRSAFLKDVARRLHGVEFGDGTVAQAAREAQAENPQSFTVAGSVSHLQY